MTTPAPAAEAAFSDEVKPYKIHVSSKYLELTRQKLELTRLPHENPEPKSKDWWEPKPIAEPVIDFWLEQYSWREEETRLNAAIPQFRTAFLVPGTESAVRLHFIHVRSPHSKAVPLLLIPPFPFTNLSLAHVIPAFTDPENAGSNQPFHLVIPSSPGLGFSDPFPNNTPMIKAAAEIFDGLMLRLGYKHYIATNSGPSVNSPAQVDWKLASYLSLNFPQSCIGFHFISPPLKTPKIRESPLEWAKWGFVNLFKSPGLGYSRQDLSALQRANLSKRARLTQDPRPEEFAFDGNGFREPNTLSYALCDSPIGLLLFVLMVLRVLGPDKELTPRELITLTELMWLPGPEATMRFWAHCASVPAHEEKPPSQKPRVAITTFTGEENGEGCGALSISPRPSAHFYACPSWGKTRFEVVSTDRVAGNPGLLAWERPEVIISGTRSLAKTLLDKDERIQASEVSGTTPLEQVVVGSSEQAPAETSGTTVHETADSSLEPAGQPKAASEQLFDLPGKKSVSQRQSTAQQPLLMDEGVVGRISEEQEEDDDADSRSSPDTVVAVGPKDAPSTSHEAIEAH